MRLLPLIPEMTMTNRESWLCEAAMCLWEHVLGLLERKDPALTELVEGVGYGQLRMDVLELAPEITADFDSVGPEGWSGGCFDWDFVPQWWDANITVSADQGLVLNEVRKIP